MKKHFPRAITFLLVLVMLALPCIGLAASDNDLVEAVGQVWAGTGIFINNADRDPWTVYTGEGVVYIDYRIPANATGYCTEYLINNDTGARHRIGTSGFIGTAMYRVENIPAGKYYVLVNYNYKIGSNEDYWANLKSNNIITIVEGKCTKGSNNNNNNNSNNNNGGVQKPADGWGKESGKWYYVENGKRVTDWKLIGGKWYYFDGSGLLVTGWKQIGGKWYFLTENGMKTGWYKSGSSWYYSEKSGAMKTGWLYDGGKWYYLKSSGAMATSWQKINGKWYWFENNGAMVTGTRTINGKTNRFTNNGDWIG